MLLTVGPRAVFSSSRRIPLDISMTVKNLLEAGIQICSHHLVYSSKLSHEELCQDPVHLSPLLYCRSLGGGGSIFSSLLPLLSCGSQLRVHGHREEAYLCG